MPVVVTITQPEVTVTASATPTSVGAALSPGAIAGIVIGTLLGAVLFITLVFYLLNRYTQHKFIKVANPVHDRVFPAKGAPDLRHSPSTTSWRPHLFTRHAQQPSMSTEPLMSPVSTRPPLLSTSRAQSLGTPRTNSISPDSRDSQFSSYDLGKISQVIASGTVSHSATPAILNIPPVRKPEQTSLRSGLGNALETSDDNAPSPPTSSQSTLFIRRMLQSRAQASEAVSLEYHPSQDLSASRHTTPNSSIFHADEERLLDEAERTALRDVENAQRDEGMIVPDEEDDWDEADTESIYSQLSAPIDHSAFFSDPLSRRNSTSSVLRRKSSRKQSREPAPELTPVAEMPDIPGALQGQPPSRRVSAAGNSSLDGQLSHRTASRPMSPVMDQPGTLPLLTSANFGKNSTASGTPPGSGWGSGSSGRTSRYPSPAQSSVHSSQTKARSDVGTDWYHPPSGLAGLSSLQVGLLRNPHSPVEELPEPQDESLARSSADPVAAKRAHLREGTASSMPEVERRTVMQGGIAHIDVAL
ncbi:hypothetical protein J3R82DRAFT_3140 [Butyriboletus roseoflavus]|nr:hypothetical protein J3R82DRAFT_3140 [Butyriboletus roseoflavus]